MGAWTGEGLPDGGGGLEVTIRAWCGWLEAGAGHCWRRRREEGLVGRNENCSIFGGVRLTLLLGLCGLVHEELGTVHRGLDVLLIRRDW